MDLPSAKGAEHGISSHPATTTHESKSSDENTKISMDAVSEDYDVLA